MSAGSYSLVPLHTRPDLTTRCVELLYSMFPHCKADRLYQLEAQTTCKGLPCSLVFYQDDDEAGTTANSPVVIGHARLVPVTSEEKAIYLDMVCIDEQRRGQGLGKKLMAMIEKYVADVFGCDKMFLRCRNPVKGFYLRIGYQLYPATIPVRTIGMNVLRSIPDVSNWYGNVPEPGWEFAYEGHEGTREEMESGVYGQNTLVKKLDF